MPYRSPWPCSATGCSRLVTKGARCEEHERAYQKQRELDTRRGTSHSRGYTGRWYKARTTYLKSHPLCEQCKKEGRVTPARVVDHIIPHRGDKHLFWDKANWQSLCDFTSPFNCHGKKTYAESLGRVLP